MRLMYTTALASAVMFAAPALAAGDKVESTTGMTQPEASAAQLPGHSGDAGTLSRDFSSAGFQNWQEARDFHILRMQSSDGQPVWVVLMSDGFRVGAADSAMQSGSGDLGGSESSSLDQQNQQDSSEQANAGDMPQRGEQADISETFQGPDGGQQPDVAEAPQAGDQQDIQTALDVPQGGRDLGGGEQGGQMGGQQDLAEVPEQQGEAGGQADIAEAPESGEQGIVGQTEPEGFAAQIPGELRSGLEGAGFQQIESVDGANVYQAETQDGQTAFIIVGDLSSAASFGGQQPIDLDRAAPGGAPGAASDLPQSAPGTTAPQPAPGQQQ
ncbi:MAG TPA: hypothetical protein VHG92_03855 [Afifellaceae bacterium]|nr:hypothetical protein [Afifellaceae bacterium]